MNAEEHLLKAEHYAIDAKSATTWGSNLVHGYVALANLHIRLAQMRTEPAPPLTWVPISADQVGVAE